MNALTQTIGNQIDTEARDSSQPLHLSTRKLVTLQDLLAELQHDKQIAMLRTTAGHITSFLNVPVEKVGIAMVSSISFPSSGIISSKSATSGIPQTDTATTRACC